MANPTRITPKSIPSKKAIPTKGKETEALKKENAELKRLLAAKTGASVTDKNLKNAQDVTKVTKDRVERMEEILSKQPKVHMNIPLEIGEKRGSTIAVGINGWTKYYPKGKMIEIPQAVFDILAAHYELTSEAGKEFEIDREDDKTKERLEALS